MNDLTFLDEKTISGFSGNDQRHPSLFEQIFMVCLKVGLNISYTNTGP
jgi:hypothetical protein